jgi:hypothetical protein
VQRAPGFPCALYLHEGDCFAKPGQCMPRERTLVLVEKPWTIARPAALFQVTWQQIGSKSRGKNMPINLSVPGLSIRLVPGERCIGDLE